MFVRVATVLFFSCLISGAVDATEKFPQRTVTLISPYQPGGTSGMIAQVLSQKLSERWAQPVIIENKPGAAGAVGIAALVRAPADGHTLLAIASNALTINPLVYKKLGYDADKDLAIVARTGVVSNVLVVNPSVSAKTLDDLVRLLKADPNKFSYASQGIGSNGQLSAELFFQRAGIKVQHVPYRGSAPAVNDLLSGSVHLMFDNLPSVLELIRSGKLRALAVTSAERDERLPEVPTIAEQGFSGFETTAWFAVAISRATPDQLIATIERDVIEVMKSPDVVQKLVAAGITPSVKGSRETADVVARELEMWRDVVSRAAISVD